MLDRNELIFESCYPGGDGPMSLRWDFKNDSEVKFQWITKHRVEFSGTIIHGSDTIDITGLMDVSKGLDYQVKIADPATCESSTSVDPELIKWVHEEMPDLIAQMPAAHAGLKQWMDLHEPR